MIHSISNQRGSWVNGTGMPSSPFLGVQELALVAGKLLTFKFEGQSVYCSDLGSLRQRL
jgi:hypothetical protein